MHLAGEDQESFHLLHPSGVTLRVPKGSIGLSTHQQIRSLPKVQHLAGGTPSEPLRQALAEGDPESERSLKYADLKYPSVPGIDPSATEQPQADVQTPMPSLDTVSHQLGLAAPAASASPFEQPPPPEAGPPPDAGQPPPPPAGQGQGQGPGLFPPMPAAPNYGALQKQVTSGLQEGIAGASLAAATAAEQSERTVPHIQEALDTARSMEAQRQQDLKGAQAFIDQHVQNVQDAKIDPNQFWHDKSTASQVATGLGLILSGIGSGLTGGPNLAAQFLQRNIDRDIDAQKAQLGKEENLVSYGYQRYHNINDAAQYARGVVMSTLAGQINLEAQRSMGPAAKAAAEQYSSQLKLGAYNIFSNLINAKYQNDWQRYQMGWTQRMMGQVMGNQMQEGYLPSRAAPPHGSDPTNPLKFAIEAQQDKANRTVIGPGGTPYLVFTNDDKNTYAPMLTAARSANAILGQLDSLRKSSVGMPGSNAANQYTKYRSDLVQQWALMHGLKQPDKEMSDNLEKVMPSKFDAFVRGGASFEPIRRLMHERTNGIYEATGLHPSAMPVLQLPVN